MNREVELNDYEAAIKEVRAGLTDDLALWSRLFGWVSSTLWARSAARPITMSRVGAGSTSGCWAGSSQARSVMSAWTRRRRRGR